MIGVAQLVQLAVEEVAHAGQQRDLRRAGLKSRPFEHFLVRYYVIRVAVNDEPRACGRRHTGQRHALDGRSHGDDALGPAVRRTVGPALARST